MNKNIIKLAITIVVAILVYSVFWFFKVGQVEKKISTFVNDNSSMVSTSDIAVSGFPFSQKIIIKDLKFSIPNSPLSKYEILVKTVEAKTGIFSSDFSTTIALDAVSLQDSDDKIFNVEFTQAPKIDFLLSDEGFASITYQDNGYKVLDSAKDTIYSAAASTFSFISNVNDEGKIINKVNVNIREIVGFDVVDFYKNSLEKRIINGLKTGEITINTPTTSGNLAQSLASLTNAAAAPTVAATNATNTPTTAAATVATPAATANTDTNKPADPTATAVAAVPNVASDIANGLTGLKPEEKAAVQNSLAQVQAAAVAPMPDSKAVPTTTTTTAPTTIATPTTPTVPTTAPTATTPEAALAAAPANSAEPAKAAEPTKSNLLMNLEFFASDTQAPQVAVPLDPTQIQDTVATGSQGKTIKINNLEFSNDLYKLYINGELNSFHDDNSLSGSISVKIEKISSLISSLLEGFKSILAEKKMTVKDGTAAPATPDLTATPDNAAINASDNKEDLYQVFLNRLIANLDPISKELAAKNPVSKEDVAVFDIRREKNLEFLVNETSIREVLGKL